jgi:hypothetical protein
VDGAADEERRKTPVFKIVLEFVREVTNDPAFVFFGRHD